MICLIPVWSSLCHKYISLEHDAKQLTILKTGAVVQYESASAVGAMLQFLNIVPTLYFVLIILLKAINTKANRKRGSIVWNSLGVHGQQSKSA